VKEAFHGNHPLFFTRAINRFDSFELRDENFLTPEGQF
jgi:hypothetical protein